MKTLTNYIAHSLVQNRAEYSQMSYWSVFIRVIIMRPRQQSSCKVKPHYNSLSAILIITMCSHWRTFENGLSLANIWEWVLIGCHLRMGSHWLPFENGLSLAAIWELVLIGSHLRMGSHWLPFENAHWRTLRKMHRHHSTHINKRMR